MQTRSRNNIILLFGVFALFPVALSLLAGCATESDSPIRPPDSTPPANTSLTFGDVTDTTVALSWRAPGDDGMVGNAAVYDLRHSTSIIDEDNFENATPVVGLEPPSVPRSLERATVGGLLPGTTYFFAIRTSDNDGNLSEVSSSINVSLPADAGDPILMAGRLIHPTGSTETAFVFQVTWRVPDPENLPSETPVVVIADSSYAMTHLPEDPPGDELYEHAIQLPAGSYSYYFSVTDGQDNTSRLPNPGEWDGPEVDASSSVTHETITVPSGTFDMGNASPYSAQDERPLHEVTLTHAFEVDKLETTNIQVCEAFNWALDQGWIHVANDTLVIHTGTGARLLNCAPRLVDVTHGIQYSDVAGFTPTPFRENWPASHISWYGAAIYCNARSALDGYVEAYDPLTWESETIAYEPYTKEGWRLPTEAEWEYMASYNTNQVYPSGDETPVAGVDGNFASVLGAPADVGSYAAGASALGILDLAGNAFEWCNDWYALYDGADAVTDPAGPVLLESRVLRGGSWSSPTDELRCDYRFSTKPDRMYDGLGFRCVRIQD